MTAATQTPPPQPALLTIDEFVRLYEGKPFELVRGRVVEVPMAGGKHGKVCVRAAVILSGFVDPGNLGHVLSNDTLIVTERGPDSGRGADVCFVSYARLPKDQLPDGPLRVAPELVFEVRSPSDRWTDVVAKALEYLNAGVSVVVILDPKTESASVYRDDVRSDIFEKDETLVLPDILPGFTVPVAKFFE